jgi:hypothetical protein
LKNIQKIHIDDRWVKAAVVGGLWASVEIIIGSFLHNTRLPFAGSMLAFAGTVLLIGFYQIWPQKGLIIRAGLITAVMKSVSPSAIILGPMTGIMMEAAAIELIILLFGNNIIGLTLAGTLSVSSALFHKVVSLLILYGFDLIQIYVNIINFALKQFGINEAGEWQILIALFSVYLFFGVLAALFGRYIGRKAVRMRNDKGNYELDTKKIKPKEFFEINEDQKTSVNLLIMHILAIPLGLYLLNFWGVTIGLPFVIMYMLVFGYRYRFALRRLKKPVFWSQLIIIVLLSAVFWDINDPDGNWISVDGILVGVEMMIRALFVVVAFSAMSVELRNQKVKDFLFGVGFGKFYQAVGLAFSALPLMISTLPGSKEIIRRPFNSFVMPLVMADSWLQLFEEYQ